MKVHLTVGDRTYGFRTYGFIQVDRVQIDVEDSGLVGREITVTREQTVTDERIIMETSLYQRGVAIATEGDRLRCSVIERPRR